MTNQEAIEILKEMKRQSEVILNNPTTFYNEKNIVSGCETMKRHIEAYDTAISALEKQIPKIPDVWGDGYDDKNNMIYDMYTCPNCGENYEIGYDHYEYCPKCGQHMDKSDKVFE